MTNFFVNISDIEAIPETDLPLLVLSSGIKSFLAWAICARTDDTYSHLMWMHRPGFFATQDWWYREVPVSKYQDSRLKFWTMPSWGEYDRQWIISMIQNELSKSWWQTRYDPLAIIGQLIGKECIEIPWTKICSDHAALLKIADPDYCLERPDPGDVNRYLKSNPNYSCYCRYTPD